MIMPADSEFDPVLGGPDGYWVDTFGAESRHRTEMAFWKQL